MKHLASSYERSNRTAPSSCFSGGHVGYGGKLIPLDEPRSLIARVFAIAGRGRS